MKNGKTNIWTIECSVLHPFPGQNLPHLSPLRITKYDFRKNLLREFSVNPADIFLENLSITDLLFHVPSFSRISTEHQKSWRQSIQSVNCPKISQVVFLGKNEDHSVVTIATAWVNLSKYNLILYDVILRDSTHSNLNTFPLLHAKMAIYLPFILCKGISKQREGALPLGQLSINFKHSCWKRR